MRVCSPALLLLCWVCSTVATAATLSVTDTGRPGDFSLVNADRAATVVCDDQEAAVVGIAARCLASDIDTVTGRRPTVTANRPADGPAVIVGTIDGSRLIRSLVDSGKLDVADLRGQWECYKYAIVDGSLVIVGSDRRGAAYGALDLSRAIGVSPWAWWADVPPKRRAQLHVRVTDAAREGPPSVKYRGIFLNDEDWGLQPWAAKTFEPETGDIGPKTYARVFELLLRLRANYCWPAMHDCTKAFNLFPHNKQVADDYAIVMGSSHCEQMLRNNVTEWPKDRHKDWNPVTNLPEITKYWETRAQENGKFENVWTVGMRGIHDGAMPGGGTIAQKRDRLEKVIGVQRDILARNVNPNAAAVPQIFCPYKEVLDIYQDGMTLPDDITIVWPDDNYGYVRQLPDAKERQRSGGNGVYYHLSYWGRPHDYLWLESNSPALVWHEMTKAYDHGAQRLWVVNVGDIKPIEATTTLFLELAWDRNRYDIGVQRAFLRDFYREQFGDTLGAAAADIKDEYFRLCAVRKPEHMGYAWGPPGRLVQDGQWTEADTSRLLARWLKLAERAEAVASDVPEASRDAYFQLVEYPTRAAAAMADKTIVADQARRTNSPELAERVRAAHQRIRDLTARYNGLANGKWRNMMSDHPRNQAVFDLPPTTRPANAATAPAKTVAAKGRVDVDVTKFSQSVDRDGVRWQVIDGLGTRGRAIAQLPHKLTPTLRTPDEIRSSAPYADYAIDAGRGGEVEVIVDALPTHRITPQHEVLAAVSINDGEPVLVRFSKGKDDENDASWQNNVLRGSMSGKIKLTVPDAAYTLRIWGADPAVTVQGIRIETQGDRSR